MGIKTYEVRVGDHTEVVVTGDVDMSCLQFSNEFGVPLQPWDFKEIEMLPVYFGGPL